MVWADEPMNQGKGYFTYYSVIYSNHGHSEIKRGQSKPGSGE